MTLILSMITAAHALEVEDFVKTMTQAWATAPETYTTSYSPCLDALVVNFRASGCDVIAQDPDTLGPGSMGLVCVMPEKANGWSTNKHVIFYTRTHDTQDYKGWDVFCVDPNITMYIPERTSKRK